MSDNVDTLKAALAKVGKSKPLLYAATEANLDAVSALSKEFDCPLTVKASKVGDVASLSAKLIEKGHKDIVLDSGHTQSCGTLAGQRYDPSPRAREALSSPGIPDYRISVRYDG